MRFLGVLAIGLIAACSESADHSHSHAPPMGGHLIELGDHEFQVEILLYPESGILEAYIWDGHAERDVRIAMKSLTVHVSVGDRSTAISLTGEANIYGKSVESKWSKFTGQHDSLKKIDHLEGTLDEITIAGKTFHNTAFHYHLGGHSGGHSGDHDHEH